MNLRVVSLGQDVSALTAENKSLAQRAAGAETLASSANSSLAEMSARLEEALAENLRAAEASAQVGGTFCDTMRCSIFRMGSDYVYHSIYRHQYSYCHYQVPVRIGWRIFATCRVEATRGRRSSPL